MVSSSARPDGIAKSDGDAFCRCLTSDNSNLGQLSQIAMGTVMRRLEKGDDIAEAIEDYAADSDLDFDEYDQEDSYNAFNACIDEVG